MSRIRTYVRAVTCGSRSEVLLRADLPGNRADYWVCVMCRGRTSASYMAGPDGEPVGASGATGADRLLHKPQATSPAATRSHQGRPWLWLVAARCSPQPSSPGRIRRDRCRALARVPGANRGPHGPVPRAGLGGGDYRDIRTGGLRSVAGSAPSPLTNAAAAFTCPCPVTSVPS